MLKKILYAIVISLVVFAVIGILLPRQVHVERSIVIDRPPATVFTVLNSYRFFVDWSPWSDRDAAALYELSGPESGVGARLSWSGDPRQVGSGWQEITESQPHSLVRMFLNFDQQGTANTYFQLDPEVEGVRVRWGFDTDLVEGQGWFGGLLARYFGLFFDRWIGTDYELGLDRLKTLIESMPPADFSGLEVELVEARPFDILYVSTPAGPDVREVGDSLAEAYQEITALMAEEGLEMAAQPMAITRVQPERGYAFEAAIPIEPAEIQHEGRVRLGRSPGGRAVRVIHRGPYERMAPTYEKAAAWMAANDLVEQGVSWEHYISDPRETPPEELVTHIYFLVEDGH